VRLTAGNPHLDTADVGLVDLDDAGELVAVGSDHRSAQLVQ
jgi:hypothetical protein